MQDILHLSKPIFFFFMVWLRRREITDCIMVKWFINLLNMTGYNPDCYNMHFQLVVYNLTKRQFHTVTRMSINTYMHWLYRCCVILSNRAKCVSILNTPQQYFWYFVFFKHTSCVVCIDEHPSLFIKVYYTVRSINLKNKYVNLYLDWEI